MAKEWITYWTIAILVEADDEDEAIEKGALEFDKQYPSVPAEFYDTFPNPDND